MTRICIVPCAGYDRPGGAVTRGVCERLLQEQQDIKIGSIAAIVAQRPGELKEVRSAGVICLDGCSMKCASKIMEQQGIKAVSEIEVTKHIDAKSAFEKRVDAVLAVVRDAIQKSHGKKETPEKETAPAGDNLYFEIDKFKIAIRKGLYYSDNDFWVSIENGEARVGATDVLQQMTSDIYFVDLVDVGTKVEIGDDAGQMESTKTALDIIIPISGEIIARNEKLLDNPELINDSPYDEGWIYVIKPSDLSELELLMGDEDYLNSASERAREEIGKKATE